MLLSEAHTSGSKAFESHLQVLESYEKLSVQNYLVPRHTRCGYTSKYFEAQPLQIP